MNRIRLALQSAYWLQEHEIKEPQVLVRIGYAGHWSHSIRAVVDTGSPYTIISPDLARRIGWEPTPGNPPLMLQGLGSQGGAPGWQATMNVAFMRSRSHEPELGLLLQDTAVVVSELVGQAAVLVGQHGSLERLHFSQRNQAPFWDFELALPVEQEP